MDIVRAWLRMNGCAWVRMVHNGFGMGNRCHDILGENELVRMAENGSE